MDSPISRTIESGIISASSECNSSSSDVSIVTLAREDAIDGVGEDRGVEDLVRASCNSVSESDISLASEGACSFGTKAIILLARLGCWQRKKTKLRTITKQAEAHTFWRCPPQRT